MVQTYTPFTNSLRTQYAVDYVVTLLSTEADNHSKWWRLIVNELFQSSIVSLKNAMTTLSDKIAEHEENALLANTHLRFMTKALNNEDLTQAVHCLVETFVGHVLPGCSLPFDFIDKDNTVLLFNEFECILFFLFCYQDEIINGLLHYPPE